MIIETPPEIRREVEEVLAEWRAKALQFLLIIISILGFVILLIQILTDTRRNSDYLSASIVFTLCYLTFLFFAFSRKMPAQARGWALLLIIYLIGVLSLARGGLAGDGRLILFILPFLAAMVVSIQACYVMVILNVVTILAFSVFAHLDLLKYWVLPDIIATPLDVSIWLIEGSYTIFILAITLPVLVLFVNFLIRTIEKELRSHKEVSETRAQLELVNQHLEEMVKQRTNELEMAMKEAQDARVAAEEGNRAKSAFLATMSHEIRTPLNAVIGMTSLLHDTPLTIEQAEYSDTIRKSSETLLSLINDILDFSKIEAGRMELDRHPFALQHCVDTVFDIVSPKAIEKSINLSWTMDADVPATIIGDETRLRQILINLVSNAVKFTEKGDVSIHISLDERYRTAEKLPAKSIQRLLFAIQDTGIGIPENRIAQLFTPFRQVDDSPSRRYSGTGLGLAICKRLVELMDGEIWAESIEHQGSIFSFTILAEPATQAQLPTRVDIRLDLSDKRILILVDNPSSRRILNLQIQAWNMVPRATHSIHEAVRWLRQGEHFDAIIVDWHSSEPGKTQLINEIRSVRTASTLPIIITVDGNQPAQAESPHTIFLIRSNKASFLYNALIGIFSKDVEIALRQDSHRISMFDPQMSTRLPLRILMVEDNNINQNLITIMLERMGYRPDLAGNGLEALQALNRQDYDVVLMDVQMPEMDGLEATRRIRKDFPLERQPRIIAMTAHAMSGDREICIASGMDDYISKPIHIEELINSLKRCEQRTSERPESAAPSNQNLELLVAGYSANLSEELSRLSNIDQAELENLRETLGSRAGSMMPTLVNSFFKQAEKLITELDVQIRSGDLSEVERLAHTLKSNSASFGANRLAHLSLHLELLARKKTLDGAVPILAHIKTEYPQVKDLLLASLDHNS